MGGQVLSPVRAERGGGGGGGGGGNVGGATGGRKGEAVQGSDPGALQVWRNTNSRVAAVPYMLHLNCRIAVMRIGLKVNSHL